MHSRPEHVAVSLDRSCVVVVGFPPLPPSDVQVILDKLGQTETRLDFREWAGHLSPGIGAVHRLLLNFN